MRKHLTTKKILLLIIAAAFIVRLAAALTRQAIQLDETAYVRMGENLAGGHGLLDISGLTSTHFSPLLPFFIAGLGVVIRNYVAAAYIVVALFGSLLLLPTYLLGKDLAGERVGLMAAGLTAAIPLFVDYSSRVYSESVYIFFLLLGLHFGWHMLKECRLRCGVLAGLSLGLAYYANPSAVFYPVALALLALGVAMVTRRWRQAAVSTLPFLAVFAVIAMPYVIFLHSELGIWTYNGKGSAGNFYNATHNLRANTIDMEKDLFSLSDDGELRVFELEKVSDPATYFLTHPVQELKIFGQQSYIFYSQDLALVVPLWLLLLLGMGLFARGWSRGRAAGYGFLTLMMAPVLIILAMYSHDRFYLPFVPLVMIPVAEGWQELERWGEETAVQIWPGSGRQTWRTRIPWFIGAVVILPVLLFAGSTIIKQKNSYPTQYKAAGEWIMQNDGAGKQILSREYTAAFYAGGTEVILPYDEYDRTTAYARAKNVDLLVISRQDLVNARPQLSRLLEAGSEHIEWELVETLYPGTDKETLIFQLNR